MNFHFRLMNLLSSISCVFFLMCYLKKIFYSYFSSLDVSTLSLFRDSGKKRKKRSLHPKSDKKWQKMTTSDNKIIIVTLLIIEVARFQESVLMNSPFMSYQNPKDGINHLIGCLNYFVTCKSNYMDISKSLASYLLLR
jgi:hypothetical protein